MIKSKTVAGLIGAAVIASLAAPVAQAGSIAQVEGARMKERQGAYLSRQDREMVRRYGSNDDYHYRGRYGYSDYGYYSGPSVGIYVGPGRYYDPDWD